MAAMAIEPSMSAAAINVIVSFCIEPPPRSVVSAEIERKHYSAATTTLAGAGSESPPGRRHVRQPIRFAAPPGLA